MVPGSQFVIVPYIKEMLLSITIELSQIFKAVQCDLIKARAHIRYMCGALEKCRSRCAKNFLLYLKGLMGK